MVKFSPKPLGKGLYAPDHGHSIHNGLSKHIEAFLREKKMNLGGTKIDYGKTRTLIFFLVDSLGRELGYDPIFKTWFENQGEWRSSVYPTITPTALSSIFTGLQPAAHGIAGHYLPWAKVRRLVDFIRDPGLSWREKGLLYVHGDPLIDRGLLDKLNPPIFSIWAHTNLIKQGILPMLFGENIMPYVTLIHLRFSLRNMVMTQLHRKVIVAYYAMHDIYSHFMGNKSPPAKGAVRSVRRTIEGLLRDLPKKTREETVILIGSDHGHSEVKTRIRFPRKYMFALKRLVHAVGKSGRTIHFFPKNGKEDLLEKLLEVAWGKYGMIFGERQIRKFMGGKSKEAIVRAGRIHFSPYPGYYPKWEGKTDLFEHGLNLGRALFPATEHGGLAANELQTPFFRAF